MRTLAPLPTPFRTLAVAAGLSAVMALPAAAIADPPSRAPTAYSTRDGTCFGMRPTIIITRRDVVTNGTDGDDVIVGTGGRDVIFGKKGNDRICALGGADRAVGNLGDDMLDGDGGADLVAGWDGNDTITGGGADDILRGNRGDDVIYADGGGDVDINLGPGSDWGFAGNGDDFMSGWGDGPAAVDNCFGGRGFDTARNCDAPVNPLTSVFDPWAGNEFEAIGPGTPH
jgi:RTX calcium-binding nonapeptide repeat (4 copies)